MTADEAKRKRSPFPRTFFVANVMEIFERMAWYGFFAVSSLYLTSPIAQGGMGFDSIQRGILQGIIPFLLYLFPVITGALADRYGYRNTFLVAFAIMTPAYFLLGQVHGFWPFFGMFLLVAIGAATFKPVVVGTVGKTTDDSNRGIGFGIFYTIVNVGGFIGPFVAGAVRTRLGWDWVFIMSAIWIGLNFIPTIFFYKEPTTESTSAEKRSLRRVLQDAQDVLGNSRFALAVVPVIIIFMIAGGNWLDWWWAIGGSLGWIVINLLLNGRVSILVMLPYILGLWLFGNHFAPTIVSEDAPLLWKAPAIIGAVWLVLMAFLVFRGKSGTEEPKPVKTADTLLKPWHKQKPIIGNWPFVLYLVILTGFWASFNQIFITMPEFIRDFVDTSDLLSFFAIFGESFKNFMSDVNVPNLTDEISRLYHAHPILPDTEATRTIFFELVHYKVRVPYDVIQQTWANFAAMGQTPDAAALAAVAEDWAAKYRQVNPEYIINIDALSIVIFQILVSTIIDRWKPFPVLVVGTIVAGVGIGMGSIALTGLFVIIAIVVFAFGEMIASPKSQEYVARIAPKQKTALFMGYYFVSVALGNLFGGILSGWGYEKVAREANNPSLMWIIFGLVGFLTAAALVFFNKGVVPKLEAQREANNPQLS